MLVYANILSNSHKYYHQLTNNIKLNIKPDTAYIQTQEYIYNNVQKIARILAKEHRTSREF